MFNSLRARVLVLVVSLLIVTAATTFYFVSFHIESYLFSLQERHARNLLHTVMLNIENEYKSILFHENASREMLKSQAKGVVNISVGIVDMYYQRYQDGLMSETEAQQGAIAEIQRIRYADDTGYVWINDTGQPVPRMIMHPTIPDLDGTVLDAERFNCALGIKKNLFVAFRDVCFSEGEGYVDYLWPKPLPDGLSEEQPKISYVRLYPQWNWILGSGLYVDDIKKEGERRKQVIIRDLKNSFMKTKVGDMGYWFCVAGDGEALVHPVLSGQNMKTLRNPTTGTIMYDDLIAAAHSTEKSWRYLWNKPIDPENYTYHKIAYIEWFEPLDWYVALSMYEEDITKTIHDVEKRVIGVFALVLMGALVISLFFSKSIIKPLERLMSAVANISPEGISGVTIPVGGTQETRALGSVLTRMTDSMKERIAELARERNFSMSLISEAAVIICGFDVNAVLTFINPAGEKMMGYGAAEIVGRRWGDISKTECADEQIRDLLDRLTEGDVTNAEMTVQVKDGSERLILWNFFAVDDVHHRAKEFVGIGNDITERRKAEDIIKGRLELLTRPLSDEVAVTFTDLFDLDEIQRIQDVFADATGVASIITDPEGKPITRPSNFCRLCNEIIRKTEQGLKNCMHSDAVLGRAHPDGPIMQRCLSSGLWDGGASIIVGGKHIANWLIGQVRNEETDEASVLHYAQEIGANEKVFRDAFSEVTVMSREQFSRVCDVLFLLAKQMSEMAFRNIQQARAIHAREAAEKALRASEENLKITLASIGDAVIATDGYSCITHMNPVAELLTGWSFGEAEGRSFSEVFTIYNADTNESMKSPVAEVMRTGRNVLLEHNTVLVARDGTKRFIADSAAPIRDGQGGVVGVVLVFRDVTEQLQIEERLHHSQKMDSIGQLAGGVAHDFNNMLAGILGSADMLARDPSLNGTMRRNIDRIIEASTRAAELTQKLLAFSRKGKIVSTGFDLHVSIRGASAILERSIDRRVQIVLRLNAPVSLLVGDQAQVQSAILNLGINARDAMPNGGTVTIETSNLYLDEDACGRMSSKLCPGQYIKVIVSDTGMGIPADVREHVFDPFFTTKEMGKGTGLGLAAVYGTVSDHRGEITVESQVGEGTSFILYLPVDESIVLTRQSVEPGAVKGEGRILVIDDEEIIRSMARFMLESVGYEVLLANDGQEGVELFEKERERISLVIVDLIMPKKSGQDTFNEIRGIDPKVPIIISSGFTHDASVDALLAQGASAFITKPYRISQLSQEISKALGRDSTNSM